MDWNALCASSVFASNFGLIPKTAELIVSVITWRKSSFHDPWQNIACPAPPKHASTQLRHPIAQQHASIPPNPPLQPPIPHPPPSLLLPNSSLLTPSPATSTSNTLPTPPLHAPSNPSTSPLTPSCFPLLSRFTPSSSCLTPTNSRSTPASIPSNCSFATNHALRPNRSSSARFSCRSARYVADAYARCSVACHASSSGRRDEEEGGEVGADGAS